MMTKEEWNSNHGFRPDGSRKRGPVPKRKKFVWEIEPGDKGTATEPAEAVDLEAMEAELEAKMMDAYIEHQASQPQTPKGKRVRGSTRGARPQPKPKSFWI